MRDDCLVYVCEYVFIHWEVNAYFRREYFRHLWGS